MKDHGGRGEEKKMKKKEKKNERVAVCEQIGVPDACEQKEYSFDGEIEWEFWGGRGDETQACIYIYMYVMYKITERIYMNMHMYV